MPILVRNSKWLTFDSITVEEFFVLKMICCAKRRYSSKIENFQWSYPKRSTRKVTRSQKRHSWKSCRTNVEYAIKIFCRKKSRWTSKKCRCSSLERHRSILPSWIPFIIETNGSCVIYKYFTSSSTRLSWCWILW